MVKKITSLNIDHEIIDKAKKAGINLSDFTERSLKDKLNYKEIEIKDKCDFCGKEEPKARMAWRC